jgi:hypothetical protein
MANFRQYSMRAASAVALQATTDLEIYLRNKPETIEVLNVEDDPTCRAQDIDLIWMVRRPDGSQTVTTIEIKGDRYYHTGNYFLETISNEAKNTPGCFLYTAADYVFYYFVEEKELHVLPMPATRDWFLQHLQAFREKKTSTPVGRADFYVTVGRLVPRSLLRKEVTGVKIISLKPAG